MYQGPKVTLEQVLESRETRAHRQKEWLKKHSLPLISFTINMVGEVKRNRISSRAFDEGYSAILDVCRVYDIPVVDLAIFDQRTGFELLISAGLTSPEELKKAMVTIEDEHPLGRLFDIDVLDQQGIAVSRDTLKLPRRKCLVCDEDAKVCARSRAHQLSELKDKMCEMINDSK